MGQKLFLSVISLAVLVFLSGCESTKDDEYVERPAEEMYEEAMQKVREGKNVQASKLFEQVEQQHPYSSWATKSQMMAAFALYEVNKYDDAIASLDRFIDLHPGNKEVAYAYYLRALCYYEQVIDVSRDQQATHQALEALDLVTKRFPNTDYAKDAKFKIDLVNNHLAGKEMEIGRFYLRQCNYIAAINRFKQVVEDHETTEHVPEALHRLVETYTILGITDEAQRYAAVLGHNYPGSNWYEDSYSLAASPGDLPPSDKAEAKSWLDNLF